MVTLFTAARSRGARIVAIEPVAELAHAVEVNAELHHVDATVLNCALGSSDADAEIIFYPGNTVMSGLHADSDEDQEVLRNYLLTGEGTEENRQLDAMIADRMIGERRTCPVLTLSQVVDRERLDRIDLLKIDVEKAESEVLAGIDSATWDIIDQIVVEVHDLHGRLGQVLGLLAERGFVVASDRDPRLELTPCHTVYGHRHRPNRRPSPPPPAPRWPTRQALTAELRAHLAAHRPLLPAPDTFVFVSALDDTLDGAPPVRELGGGAGTLVLAEIWAKIFGESAVRNDADFFDLGGDSLTGVRLLTQIESRLGNDVLAPDTVFTASRFADLAAAVEAGLAERRSA